MRQKLGLFSEKTGDNDLLNGLYALMERRERLYAHFPAAQRNGAAQPRHRCAMNLLTERPLIPGLPSTARLQQEQVDDASRQQAMKVANPAMVLRTGWRNGRSSRRRKAIIRNSIACMKHCAIRGAIGMMTTVDVRQIGVRSWKSAVQANSFWLRYDDGAATSLIILAFPPGFAAADTAARHVQ
jgi:hypothetical protein